MNPEHQQILDAIAHHLETHPDQRFGQALFNPGINEMSCVTSDGIQLRDIFYDSDEKILERMKG